MTCRPVLTPLTNTCGPAASYLAKDGAHHLRWLTRAAHIQRHRWKRILLQRHIHASLRRLSPRRVVRGSGHTDDLSHLVFARYLAGACPTRPCLASSLWRAFVHDRDGNRRRPVKVPKVSPTPDRDTTGLEIAEAHGVDDRRQLIGRRLTRTTLDLQPGQRTREERHVRRPRDRLDSWRARRHDRPRPRRRRVSARPRSQPVPDS